MGLLIFITSGVPTTKLTDFLMKNDEGKVLLDFLNFSRGSAQLD
jgi:hypothetical protein